MAYKELLQRQERQQKLASLVQRTAFQKELMVRQCGFVVGPSPALHTHLLSTGQRHSGMGYAVLWS